MLGPIGPRASRERANGMLGRRGLMTHVVTCTELVGARTIFDPSSE
jgi:hypothetical protein